MERRGPLKQGDLGQKQARSFRVASHFPILRVGQADLHVVLPLKKPWLLANLYSGRIPHGEG
jgi:hypothetical protein